MSENKRCPHCGEEVEYLKYECSLIETGYEWGEVSLSLDDHTATASELTDNRTEDYVYTCPECSVEINSSDELLEIEDEDVEEETEEELTLEQFNMNNLKLCKKQ